MLITHHDSSSGIEIIPIILNHNWRYSIAFVERIHKKAVFLNTIADFLVYNIEMVLEAMQTRKTTLELLHAIDGYNRISLRKAWSDAKTVIKKVRIDRLSLNYGDSRINSVREKRRRLSEGLKICR